MPRRLMPSSLVSGRAFLSPRRVSSWVLASSFLALATLPACSDSPKNASDLASPRSHLAMEDRGASGGEDTLRAGGVNAYLWRASLDTLSFMPIATADAQGGLILTDWYTPPATQDERFKITAFILDRRLRSDALRLSVFRQIKQDGQWVDTPAAGNTASDIAARILARARKLRANNGNNDN